MSEARTVEGTCGPIPHRANAAARRTADWLCLAAAPTFALMALLTVPGDGAGDMLCSAAHRTSPLNGMAVMYLLMSAFHAAPWLRRLRALGGHRAFRAIRRAGGPMQGR